MHKLWLWIQYVCWSYYLLLMKFKIEEEERNFEAAIKETEKQCEKVTSELKELELKSIRFTELEEW